jgi:tetratricopeptide (TPR) repeat protein
MERVPEELCRHIGREVSKGLAAIHEAGVVHRDLKPENVLITPDHQIKVMDLGVARLMDEAVRLSQTGAFVGSLHYAAPAQFDAGGKDLDGRADLHALGLVLYELATGQHPFLADSVPEIVKHVLRTEPRKVGQIHPQLSAFFEEVVHTLLEKSADERFQDAATLLGALEAGEDSAWWRERARQLQATTKRPIRRIRIPRETAVYGREKEIAKLRGLYEQAKSGDGQVVLLEGEAGIGKSRLVDELIRRLQADGEDVNFLFGSYPPGGAATASGAFSAAYREHFGEGGSADYLTQTPILVPAFDALLKGETAPSGVEQLTKDSLQTCFVNVTRSLAAERVTIVLIDDLHFAPEEGRALFTALAHAVPGDRVLLIGTTRPGVSEEWVANLSRPDHCARIEVARLGPKDLAELLRDCFKSEELAIGLAGQIGIKSDGNPFFAFEIIRGLREGQFITQRDDGTWASTQIIDEIQIPSSVLDLVNARVADLSEDERDLLDVACCWGFEFDATIVGDALGAARIPTLKRFAQVEKKHRLVRCAGEQFVFDHHQVQEALYGALPPQLAREYHAALAEALETRTKAAEQDPEQLDGALCVDICEHYLKGARGESALRYLKAAQNHLQKGYLHAQVIALSERALAAPDLLAGTERANALLRLVGALELLGRRERQEECAREAERLADESGDDELRGRTATALGTLFWRTSRHEEAETAYRRALELAASRGDARGEAIATGNLGSIFQSIGRLSEAREHLERQLALCHEIGYREGEAIATGNLGVVFASLGCLPEAQEHQERYLALSRELGDRLGEADATMNLGSVFYSQGRLPEAQEYFERSLALSREIGDRRGEAAATGNLGSVFWSLGRLPEAQEYFERSLALSREIGDRLGEAVTTGNLGNVFDAQGRLREAQDHYERHLALSREVQYRLGEAFAQHNLGGVLRQKGERAGSEERLLSSLAICEEIGHRHLAAVTHLALGSLRAAQSRSDGGDEEGGRESLVAARDLAREVGIPVTETMACCELALLAGGKAEDALATFTEHEERLGAGERLEAHFLLWRATHDRTHLESAKRLLDEELANVPEEYHESMRQNVRINREILAAWRKEFGDDSEDDATGPDDATGGSPAESPTRVR